MLKTMLPLPYSYRRKYSSDSYSDQEISELYAEEVVQLIRNARNKGCDIAAFLFESFISCGGQVILPPGYLKRVYRLVGLH